MQREDLDARGEEQLPYVLTAYAEAMPRDDAGTGPAVGDADGFAAVFRIVELFGGGKKRVYVYERDEAGPVLMIVRHGTTDCKRVNREGSNG